MTEAHYITIMVPAVYKVNAFNKDSAHRIAERLVADQGGHTKAYLLSISTKEPKNHDGIDPTPGDDPTPEAA